MPKDRARIKGKVTATVFRLNDEGLKRNALINRDPNLTDQEKKAKRIQLIEEFGSVKTFKPKGFRKLLGLAGKPMASVNHNIVTDEGDALIADLMCNTPVRIKVDYTNGYIAVGTGYVSESKSAIWVTTPTGSAEQMDSGYPQLKDPWGTGNDNVTVYKSTFEAGELNATGINEAVLANNTTEGTADCLAYAQITPSVDVTTADTLQITWEITFTGA